MGLISAIFGNKVGRKSDSKLVDLFVPYFSSNQNPKLNDTFMSAVNTHATHFSKIRPQALLNNKPTKQWLTHKLSVSPNAIMDASTFWERVCRNYYLENNAFIYVDWDPKNTSAPIRGLWILDPLSIEVKYDPMLQTFVFRFNLQGSTITCEHEDIIHLARHVDEYGIFGQKSSAINQVLSVINTNYQGIENAIRTSAYLRFILTSTTQMKEDDRKKKAQNFADTYLTKDGTGIAFLDSSMTLTKIDSSPKYANADEMKVFEEKIMRYMNISPAIMTGDFTENQWQSYYETNMEPLILKLQNELERKLFTEREYSQGNRIVIASNMLQVANLTSKNNLIMATKELGIMTINEYREMLNLPPLEEGGDERYFSKNYANVGEKEEGSNDKGTTGKDHQGSQNN